MLKALRAGPEFVSLQFGSKSLLAEPQAIDSATYKSVLMTVVGKRPHQGIFFTMNGTLVHAKGPSHKNSYFLTGGVATLGNAGLLSTWAIWLARTCNGWAIVL